jgi:opacity protein-like surface antigen
MFKGKIIAAVAAMSMVSAGIANAGAFDNTRFSLGAELSLLNHTTYTSANTPDINNFKSSSTDTDLVISKNKSGFNFFANARFSENIGLEIGYGFIFKVSGTAQLNRQATNRITNTYIDFMAYLPVAAKVDLIGTLGLGMLKSKANVSGATFNNLDALNNDQLGIRVGGGAQYNIDNNWSSRALLRYQKGNKNFLKSLTSLSIGLGYTF